MKTFRYFGPVANLGEDNPISRFIHCPVCILCAVKKTQNCTKQYKYRQNINCQNVKRNPNPFYEVQNKHKKAALLQGHSSSSPSTQCIVYCTKFYAGEELKCPLSGAAYTIHTSVVIQLWDGYVVQNSNILANT